MTADLLVAVIIQVAAAVILRLRLGRSWLAHPFTLLIVMAIIYHGLSALLLAIPDIDEGNIYRGFISPTALDDAALLAAAAILAGVVGYLVTRPRSLPSANDHERALVVRVLNWRWTLILCVPLVLASVSGQGKFAGKPLDASQDSWLTLMAVQFLMVLLVVTSFSIVTERGSAWFLPALTLQTAALALAGQRLELLAAAAMLWVLLRRVEKQPPTRQLVGGLAVASLLVLGIPSTRADVGRQLFYTNTSAADRLSSMGEAMIQGLSGSSGSPSSAADPTHGSLLSQFANRIDSNSFLGAVQDSFAAGADRLNVSMIPTSLTRAIPSIFLPGKLDGPVETRDPETAAIVYLGIPARDYLPGVFGLYLPNTGVVGLPVFAMTFGLIFGFAERFSLARVTPSRLVLLALLVQGAMFYEAGLPVFMVILRGALPLIIFVKLVELVFGNPGSRSPNRVHTIPCNEAEKMISAPSLTQDPIKHRDSPVGS